MHTVAVHVYLAVELSVTSCFKLRTRPWRRRKKSFDAYIPSFFPNNILHVTFQTAAFLIFTSVFATTSRLFSPCVSARLLSASPHATCFCFFYGWHGTSKAVQPGLRKPERAHHRTIKERCNKSPGERSINTLSSPLLANPRAVKGGDLWPRCCQQEKMPQHVSAVFGSVITEGDRTAGRAGVECLQSFFWVVYEWSSAAVFFSTVHLRVMQRDGEERFINNPTSMIESWSNFFFPPFLFLSPPSLPTFCSRLQIVQNCPQTKYNWGVKKRSKKDAHKEKAK